MIPQNIEADRSVCIDVWVVNLRREADFGRFEWVIRGEHDGEEKNAARVRRVSLYIIRHEHEIQVDQIRDLDVRGP